MVSLLIWLKSPWAFKKLTRFSFQLCVWQARRKGLFQETETHKKKMGICSGVKIKQQRDWNFELLASICAAHGALYPTLLQKVLCTSEQLAIHLLSFLLILACGNYTPFQPSPTHLCTACCNCSTKTNRLRLL